jgi:hypothetical protein
MRIDIVTIFPEMCAGPLSLSMMGRAREKGLLDLRVHDLREWATDRHRRVDDEPYGGGQGMVMKCEPWCAAVEGLRGEGTRTVLLQAGLPPQWWPFAAKFFCFACNIDESQGPSPWSRRHGATAFKGIRCPFGALVDFLPPQHALARLPMFGPRGTPGLFQG